WDDPYEEECFVLLTGRKGALSRAVDLQHSGRPEAAVAILRDLADDPSDSHSQIFLGTILLQMGRLDEAERYFRAAVGGATEQAQASYFLATALCGEAARLVQQPGDGPAQARMKYKEAAAFAEHSLALNPDNVMTRICLGQALAGQGETIEAIQ